MAREKCGITVNANEPEKMADAVQLLAENDVVQQEMAKNSQRVAIELFDRDLLARAVRWTYGVPYIQAPGQSPVHSMGHNDPVPNR